MYTSPCQRCKQTTNGPQAFLLTCRACNKTWHHRCHMPPVEDAELIRRIRATNAGDKANDLSSWLCRRCTKAPSNSSEARRSFPASITNASSTTSVTPAVDASIKQESSTAVVALGLTDRERNKKRDPQESTVAPPVQRTFISKRTKSSAAKQPNVPPPSDSMQPRDSDVQMADPKSTAKEKEGSPPRLSSSKPSPQGSGLRKVVSAVSVKSPEDDDQMEIEILPPTFSLSSHITSRASQAPSSDSQAIKPVSEEPPRMHTAPSEREVRPADGVPSQSRVNQDADDDPEDLYGPPVERRVIRILPSLAEELREQQRRSAAEKEKRRAPLAPDWIFAKHVNDPLWKETRAEGRTRRKPIARKLGDNGVNVSQLLACFTVQNWVQEHRT